MTNRRQVVQTILSSAAGWAMRPFHASAATVWDQATVASFSASGSDDTERLLAAFQWLQSAQNRMLVLDATRYVVSSRIGLTNAQNFRIEGNGATIAAADSMPVQDGFQILYFEGCADGRIDNLNIDGNRSSRSPAEVPAHSVQVYSSCARLTFQTVRSDNAAVDGFYVASQSPDTLDALPTDIVFRSCTANNAYRNNLTVINSNRFRDYDGVYTNANGTLPMAGADFEPNDSRDLGNIDAQCFRTQCNNNTGPGFQIDGPNTHVVLNNVVADANSFGGIVGSWGYLDIEGATLENYGSSVRRGIIDAFDNSGQTIINNVVARNCNTGSDSKPIIYVHPVHSLSVNINNVQAVDSASIVYDGSSDVQISGVSVLP